MKKPELFDNELKFDYDCTEDISKTYESFLIFEISCTEDISKTYESFLIFEISCNDSDNDLKISTKHRRCLRDKRLVTTYCSPFRIQHNPLPYLKRESPWIH